MTLRAIAILSTAFAYAAAAAAPPWAQDDHSSRLEFVATYEGQAATGRFADFTTRLTFDPAQPEQASLQVSIPMASAEMGSDDLSQAIRETEWLDIAHYPRAEFQSTRILGRGKGEFVAHGRLTIKGTTRDVEVPFTWTPTGRAATMTGQIELDRTAFHVGTGEWADGSTIRREVAVSFDLRLHRVD